MLCEFIRSACSVVGLSIRIYSFLLSVGRFLYPFIRVSSGFPSQCMNINIFFVLVRTLMHLHVLVWPSHFVFACLGPVAQRLLRIKYSYIAIFLYLFCSTFIIICTIYTHDSLWILAMLQMEKTERSIWPKCIHRTRFRNWGRTIYITEQM